MNKILNFSFYRLHEQTSSKNYVVQFISIFDHWLTRNEFENYFPNQANENNKSNNKKIADCMIQLSSEYRGLAIDAWPDGKIESKPIDSDVGIDEVRRKICTDSFYEWFGLYFERLDIVMVKGYEYTFMCVSVDGIPQDLRAKIENCGLYVLEKSA